MIKQRIKVISITFFVILALLCVIFIIIVATNYKHHELNQKYIRPEHDTTWYCKELDMTLTCDYDIEQETFSHYGEIVINGKKTNLIMDMVGTGDTMDFFNAEDFNNKYVLGEILFSGEFSFVNEKEFKLKISDNNFLPSGITKLNFIEK